MLMELQSKGRGEEAQALAKGQLEQHSNAKSGDSGDNKPERAGQSSAKSGDRVSQSSMTMPRVVIVGCDDKPIVLASTMIPGMGCVSAVQTVDK
jgi:hypothetical protein